MLLRSGVIALFVVCLAPVAARAADPAPAPAKDAAYERRLALARATLADSHRAEVEEAIYTAMIERSATGCQDQECKDAWKAAYTAAVHDAVPAHLEDLAIYAASTLSEQELLESAALARSPIGQSIAIKQVATAKVAAEIATAFQADVTKRSAASFCAAKPKYCRTSR